MTLAQTVDYIFSLKSTYPQRNQNIGLSLNVDEAAWYRDTYNFDLTQLLFTELENLGLAPTTTLKPLIINSYSS